MNDHNPDLSMTLYNINKIVKSHNGIDTYGILSILSREYGYDPIRDTRNFDDYLKEVCKIYPIKKDGNKYYSLRTYMIPVTFYGDLKVDSCENCRFTINTSYLPDFERTQIIGKDNTITKCCVFDLQISCKTGMKYLMPSMCPRNQLYEKIYKSEVEPKEEPEEENEVQDKVKQHELKTYVIPRRGPISAQEVKDLTNLYAQDDIQQYIHEMSERLSTLIQDISNVERIEKLQAILRERNKENK